MANKKYLEKLKDPRWQRLRLEVFQRDEFTCQMCQDTETTLHVHHMNYHGYNPWETPPEQLITLCENCHEHESSISKEAENSLVRSIKSKRFLSSDLFVLSEGFENMYVVNCAEVTAYAIRDLFSNEDKMKALVRNYLSEIK